MHRRRLESCISSGRHHFYKLGPVGRKFFTKADSGHFSSTTTSDSGASILDLSYFILELIFNKRTKLQDILWDRNASK